MTPELEFAIEAATRAGKVIMSYFRGQLSVSEKGTKGPVTEADLAADALLRKLFATRFPQDGWISEESPPSPSPSNYSRVWIVDPLDGTREFISGIEEFAVSIALVDAGKPCIAVVHNPASGDLFYAEAGGGTFCNGSPGATSLRNVMRNARIVASRNEPVLLKLLRPFGGADCIGSIAFKLALVSAGAADLVISLDPKCEWDLCAGGLLVTEAGGKITDAGGNVLRYKQEDPLIRGVVAANPELHAEALAWIPPSL